MLAIHDAQIAEHGGAEGVRDLGMLESALARPRNAAAYDGEATISQLAALYALGIIRDHPFVDGNKRVGLVLLELFLALNGLELRALDAQCYEAIVGAASGDFTEAQFIAWVHAYTALRRF
uniref:Putative death-on-curing protein Doc n=1 Tax=mine drainage metagenome TaxID=410659 RepID=E6Q864_9ZZZZ